ncbi:hypothetical protein VTK73DRAFT_5501 [Phialemonium thermophilum]|uniref:Uncharacterized protein n=1 Tax=Phialemonium thermophilum TaxID=223376 RepID=A0ABR3V1E3_9PEZI
MYFVCKALVCIPSLWRFFDAFMIQYGLYVANKIKGLPVSRSWGTQSKSTRRSNRAALPWPYHLHLRPAGKRLGLHRHLGMVARQLQAPAP